MEAEEHPFRFGGTLSPLVASCSRLSHWSCFSCSKHVLLPSSVHLHENGARTVMRNSSLFLSLLTVMACSATRETEPMALAPSAISVRDATDLRLYVGLPRNRA